MSCVGCIFAGKGAGCDFSYACNTEGRPIAKPTPTENKSKKDHKAKKNATITKEA